jgi:predicted nucleotidyltransferase
MKKLQPRVRALRLAKEVRIRLTKELGQSVKVIMFGSQARGDATKESDIDLLVILPVIDAKTTRLASDIAWEVGFDAGRVISMIPDTKEQMKRFAFLPFYQTIKREGIAV